MQVALNDLETISLVASMGTVYCGIFFLSDMPEIYESTDPNTQNADNGLRLNNALKLVMFFFILFLNCFFFVYWAVKIYREIKVVIMKKFKRVYIFLCLC